MMKRIYLIASGLCFACALAFGQEVSVRAVLDTNRGLIGDQFVLRLLVEKPSDAWEVTFPTVAEKLADKIEVLNIKPIDTNVSDAGQVLSQDLLVTVFDTGFFEIPALTFGISNATFSDTLNTLPVLFEIQAMKQDSTIRDIKGIYKIPLSLREAAPYILGVIALGLIVWLIIHFIRNIKLKEPQRKDEVWSEPADIIALRELAQLRDEKPWLNNRIKYYYIRISDILRTYIERGYHTLAMEQTTGEIIQSLRNKNMETADLNQLSDILRLADLVKFAKVIPDPEQNALQVGQAEEFVRHTSAIRAEKVSAEEIVESNTK